MKEKELFDYLKTKYYPDLFKSESEFDTFDCQSDRHRIYAELKTRHTFYDRLIIEKAKYEALMIGALRLSYTPLYINSTPMGVISFDMNKMGEPAWEEKWLPATTEFNKKNHRTKTVGFLDVSMGNVI